MTSAALSASLEGFFLGASLIIAIGAQNAFVLRQGLVGRHVGPIVAICALSDAALISAGAAGMGSLVNALSWLFVGLAFAGAAFLAWYGLSAARRALHPASLEAAKGEELTLKAAVLLVLALTWGNPHVYLDTVVLLGGISGRYPVETRVFFAGGAMLASCVWFAALGYGARLLQPVFRKPAAWRVLDAIIALVMLSLALKLALEGWARLG
ncbi:LysE/ArgO family amino acid transporter [Oryzibacter oryziterrae]|uniref:LysE/ArgO family amino acid transporter n=1 Tax=Oryzibacter oryziterrae TaxID=2766474 RepID=UPI001F3C1EFD|nr:LysE/ArgO family amino acid transporter [Oryzibacter oryziterrae]